MTEKLNMRSNTTNGFLITFCGLDGCGKTTMISRLFEDLRKERQLLLTKEPTDFVRQSNIFRTYMDCEDHSKYDYRSLSLLCASDRIQHSNKVIEPAMAEEKIVISDRYFYSCLANLCARGFEHDKWIYEVAESIVKPDIAFFLDVSVDEAINRVRSRPSEKDRYIDIDLQYKLRKYYIEICRANDGILISTEESEDKCYSIIKQTVERVINK